MPTSAVLSARTVVGSIAVAAILLLAGVLLGGWEQARAQDGVRAVAITVGSDHACALLDSGAVECWGDNRFGQARFGQADAPSGRFSGAADVPAWLRLTSLSSTGTGGLLNRRVGALELGAIALAALAIPTLSLLTLSAWRRSRT